MYELQIEEYRVGMDRMSTEMAELKRKYYAQKRLLQKARQSRSKAFAGPSLPAIAIAAKRFCGGGFKMAAPTPRNCFTADDACR